MHSPCSTPHPVTAQGERQDREGREEEDPSSGLSRDIVLWCRFVVPDLRTAVIVVVRVGEGLQVGEGEVVEIEG